MTKYLIFSLIIIALILPFSTRAFLNGPIVPCGQKEDNPNTPDIHEDKDCTLCDIFLLIQNIINFIWELILVIAPVFVLAGGIVILTAGPRPDQVSLGKRIITSAVIGVIIALLAWTIINMLFNALVSEEEGFPWPWNKIECEGGGISEGEEETTTPGYRCNQMSPAGPCLGNYYCQKGVADQLSQAAPELKNLLNCMDNELLHPDAKEISSISDNSGGRCFNDWNGQCPEGVDSCTGTCCGHMQYSLHYGGRNCRGTSYAVDFANEIYGVEIMEAAKKCREKLNLGKIDVENEGNHIHLELDGLARDRGCL